MIDGSSEASRDPLIRRADALLVASGWEPDHVRQVTRLAVLLFDQLAGPLCVDPTCRRLLEAAGLLHDTCFLVDEAEHHKEAYRLAVDELSLEFGVETAEVVGNIARYHRKARPKASHAPFARLTPEHQTLVRQLASLLRIADGLDRLHRQKITTLRCDLTAGMVTIWISASGDIEGEIAGGEGKTDLFEETFGRKVRLRQERPTK